MRKSLLTTITLASLLPLFCLAQEAQAEPEVEAEKSRSHFRFDTAIGGSLGGDMGNGIVASLEPKYLPHKNFGIGLRLDGGGRQSVDVGDGAAIEQSAFGSYSLKGEYYPLTQGTFRPYGGLSLGRYSIAKQSVGSSSAGTGISQAGGTFNGVGAFIGVDIGRFRLSASHHMLLNSEFEVMQTIGNVDQQVKLNQNYSTIEVGFRFGG